MLQLQKGMGADDSCCSSGGENGRMDSCEDHIEEMSPRSFECSSSLPLDIGNIRVTSLGVFSLLEIRL